MLSVERIHCRPKTINSLMKLELEVTLEQLSMFLFGFVCKR